jgi:hypothetical protein
MKESFDEYTSKVSDYIRGCLMCEINGEYFAPAGEGLGAIISVLTTNEHAGLIKSIREINSTAGPFPRNASLQGPWYRDASSLFGLDVELDAKPELRLLIEIDTETPPKHVRLLRVASSLRLRFLSSESGDDISALPTLTTLNIPIKPTDAFEVLRQLESWLFAGQVRSN